jgi:hypothetical protein
VDPEERLKVFVMGSLGIEAPWLRTCRPVIPWTESQKMNVATMLKRPIRDERMPDAMTIRQRGRPKVLTLVALLLRLPRMLKPRMIIDVPRKTKPDSMLSNGQFLAKYDLKRVSSETMRKRAIMEVMKCETPSKKKKLEVLTVMTSITQLAAATVRSDMMLRTRRTFRMM